jgi:hypothetical protein
LVYRIARGRSMAERSARDAAALKEAQDTYIRETAGATKTPAEQISDARELLTSGDISESEFDMLKAKALA